MASKQRYSHSLPLFDIHDSESMQVVNLIHEVGAAEVVEDITIFPAKHKQTLRIKSRLAGTASGAPTPEYLATIRRRKAKNMVEAIEELAAHADHEGFPVFTSTVVERLKGLIESLADAKREGNTRAILNALRSSFFDGGWDRYRDPLVRALATECMKFLSTREWVCAEDADHWLDRLIAADLQITAAMVLH